MKGPPFGIRPLARPSREENLVWSSWLQSQRKFAFYGADGSWPTDGERGFFTRERARIEALMARPGLVILAAYDPADVEQIFGWVAFEREPKRCHYLYVKAAFRGLGIARALYEAADKPRVCTSRGFAFAVLAERYGLNFEEKSA